MLLSFTTSFEYNYDVNENKYWFSTDPQPVFDGILSIYHLVLASKY